MFSGIKVVYRCQHIVAIEGTFTLSAMHPAALLPCPAFKQSRVVNSIFSRNTAEVGGAASLAGDARLAIDNSSFWRNR
jgi:hypothetical protein